MTNTTVEIQSPDLQQAEISWFAPLCNEDFRYLGQHDDAYRSSWENTSAIVKAADEAGFRNILCPSSYQAGQDTLTFASAMAPLTNNINLLAAIRCGEVHPPMLARTVATLDHILKGRLTLNIISSDMPGLQESSEYRYQRSKEVVEILRQAWTQEEINYQGQCYQLSGLTTRPVKPYQQNGGPLLYFGGYSPAAVALCAEFCDVYLMWPENEENLAERMKAVANKAAEHNRKLDYGLRVHMVVRDTEAEAKEYANEIMAKLDEAKGEEIRNRSLDAKSLGVSFQAEQRKLADDEGFSEPHLWTRIGEARSGCGAALVGSVDQVLSKIERYQKMGMRSFIFSGYPHLDECKIVGEKVLSQLQTCSLPEVYNRVPTSAPDTPLAAGKRL
jgi:alkanesulfonate monooxygenase